MNYVLKVMIVTSHYDLDNTIHYMTFFLRTKKLYYTNKAWGVASCYHLSIDASVLGIDDTVLFIKDFVMRRMEILSHQ